jgi:hypothetical protein
VPSTTSQVLTCVFEKRMMFVQCTTSTVAYVYSALGLADGLALCDRDGLLLGDWLGDSEGDALGEALSDTDGDFEGLALGLMDGEADEL